MQTHFSLAQLADAATADVEKILRSCVHCGFCTATCPTYVTLGDELDSPRGRIYLIKDMLENDRPASERVAIHLDRCLTCLSCMTTCPSGVHYLHLVDHARAYVERTHRRPLADRTLRAVLARVLSNRTLFRAALLGAWAARPLGPLASRLPVIGPRLSAMLRLVPSRPAGRSAAERPGVWRGAAGGAEPATASIGRASAQAVVRGRGATPAPDAVRSAPTRRRRALMMVGCAQPALRPEINDAAIRLLNRLGVDVAIAKNEGCCGALTHHLGREAQAHEQAARNVDAWTREIEGEGLDAILITASGCGTTVKDYGWMFRHDPAYADKARRVAELARDVSEYLAGLDLSGLVWREDARGLVVAYHSACSMQHGQKIVDAPKTLLRTAGFVVKDPPEGHLCCGSAGVYNILQPQIAERLRTRKLKNIARSAPQIVATGNIGCMTQLAGGLDAPILHTVELLDWASGGPTPPALETRPA
jgi:glycolate oxidase iron-sulfur subunit